MMLRTFLLLILPGAALAGDLVYEPVNPAFGGNPFNGEWLLNQAQIQNQYEADEPSLLEDFERGLNQRLLGRVSAEIEDRLFGENPQDSGSIPLGDLQVDFERVGQEIILTVTDFTTGGETVIEIPAPAF